MSEKPRLFLSHIHEEAALARVLKKWTQKSFLGQCDVFVSSDKDSIPAGSKWFDKIGEALAESRIFVVLCSPESLQRPWINFETGYGFAKGVEVLPVCHSGQKKGELPRTLSEFTAVEIGEENFCADYLWGIAKPLGYSEIPDIDGAKMMAELTKALPKYDRTKTGRGQSVDKDSGENLPPKCEKILKLILHTRTGAVTINDVASCLGMSLDKQVQKQKVMFFMEILLKKKLIEGVGMQNILDGTLMGWSEFRLSSEGREWFDAAAWK